jgi:hypothetical protein
MASLFYMWTTNAPGTAMGANTLQLVYSNSGTGIALTDAVTVLVAPPLVISGGSSINKQLVSWSSAPGVTYQVFATTNLSQPFQLVSTNVPSQGSTTSFYDTNSAAQKFYEIEAIPQ